MTVITTVDFLYTNCSKIIKNKLFSCVSDKYKDDYLSIAKQLNIIIKTINSSSI